MEFISLGLEKAMGSTPMGFLPSRLTGLKLWARFNAGIATDAFGVTQWDDQSGNENHLKQSTDANKPAKQSDGSILFDGGNDVIKADAFTFEQPESIYLLFKQITWTNGDRIYDGNTDTTGVLYQNGSTPEISLYAGTALSDVSLTLDTYGVISTVLNGSSSVLQLNNDTPVTGDAGATDMSGFTLGASGAGAAAFSRVQVKEVIAFDEAHDAATRAQVIKYLADVGDLSI